MKFRRVANGGLMVCSRGNRNMIPSGTAFLDLGIFHRVPRLTFPDVPVLWYKG